MADTPAATWADLLDLVSTLDASEYAEVDIEMRGLRLRMSTTAGPPVPTPSSAAPEPAPPAPADDDTAVAGVAPMLGPFYRRPAPGADPVVGGGAPPPAGPPGAAVRGVK